MKTIFSLKFIIHFLKNIKYEGKYGYAYYCLRRVDCTDLCMKKKSKVWIVILTIDNVYLILIMLKLLFRSLLLWFMKQFSSKLTTCSMLEVIHQISCPLNASIGQLAYLFTIKFVPSAAIEFFVELMDKFSVNKVYKSIADIAWIKLVNRKI